MLMGRTVITAFTLERVIAYTDGTCTGGVGGWASILTYGENEREITGSEKDATSQRMELLAVVKALRAIKSTHYTVIVHTSSAFIVNAMAQNWLTKWKGNGWRDSKSEPVVDQDLWAELLELSQRLKIELVKARTKTNRDLDFISRCDRLAKLEIRMLQRKA